MPRIAVYLKSEDPQTKPATHSSTKALWACVVADRSGVLLRQDVGQLLTGESWRQVKDRLRPDGKKGRMIPRLKAPRSPSTWICVTQRRDAKAAVTHMKRY